MLAAPAVTQECPEGWDEKEVSEEAWGKAGQEAADSRGEPAPAGHPFGAVTKGMSHTEVRLLLGNPDDIRSYRTGKEFIPYYVGDDLFRTEMRYRGVGRVVLSRGSDLVLGAVTRIDFNPSETGRLWIGERCGTPPPGADAFGKIRPGMLDITVRGLLGHPDHARTWTRGQAYNPLYFGNDRQRAAWTYEGIGTVTFFQGTHRFEMHVLKAERSTSAK